MRHLMTPFLAAMLCACAIDNGADSSGGGQQDLSLDADVAELKREAQKAVDRNIAARAELAASNAELDAVEAKIGAGAQDALDFVQAYRNPRVENPETPIAPDVAAEAPVEEPPVFTDVSTPGLDDTSGGATTVDASFLAGETDAGSDAEGG